MWLTGLRKRGKSVLPPALLLPEAGILPSASALPTCFERFHRSWEFCTIPKVPALLAPVPARVAVRGLGITGIGIPGGSTGAWLPAPAACVPGPEPAVIPACRDAGKQHQGGRETPGTDPGPSGKAGSLLPWWELMTLLANITGSLSGILTFPRAPPCSCSFP